MISNPVLESVSFPTHTDPSNRNIQVQTIIRHGCFPPHIWDFLPFILSLMFKFGAAGGTQGHKFTKPERTYLWGGKPLGSRALIRKPSGEGFRDRPAIQLSAVPGKKPISSGAGIIKIVTPNSFLHQPFPPKWLRPTRYTSIYLGKPLSRASSVLWSFWPRNSSQTLLFTLHGNAPESQPIVASGRPKALSQPWLGRSDHTQLRTVLNSAFSPDLLRSLYYHIFSDLHPTRCHHQVAHHLKETQLKAQIIQSPVNIVLVCEVQEGPENSRVSICRGRFIFTPTYFETGKGARAVWTVNCDPQYKLKKLQEESRVSRGLFLRALRKLLRSGRGPSNRVRLWV